MPASTSKGTGVVVSEKSALRAPAGTVTLAAPAAAAGWELAGPTSVPPASAEASRVTVPVTGFPPVTVPGLSVTLTTLGPPPPAGITDRPPCAPTPLIVATSVTGMLCVTVLVVIGKETEYEPAGTVTVAGTLTGMGRLRVRSSPWLRSWYALRRATSPPAGAGS